LFWQTPFLIHNTCGDWCITENLEEIKFDISLFSITFKIKQGTFKFLFASSNRLRAMALIEQRVLCLKRKTPGVFAECDCFSRKLSVSSEVRYCHSIRD